MLKKGRDDKLVMIYVDYTTEFPLPNQNLGLYAVDSLVFDLQRKEEAPHRSASARITRNPRHQYRGYDPITEGPAYTGYIGLDQAGPS